MRGPTVLAIVALLLAGDLIAAGADDPATTKPDNNAPVQVPLPNPGRVPAPGVRIVPFGRGRGPRLSPRIDEEAVDRVPLSVDRQIFKEMETAGDLLSKKQYPEATLHLQHVLDSPEDSWIEVSGPHGSVFQSAKLQAADRIGALPLSARESYETEFGQVARQMLEEATRRGDRAGLAELVSRYFQTRAGYQAAYALGNRLFDASMPLSAAKQFERLRKSPGGGAFEPMLSLKEAFCWLRIGSIEKCRAMLADVKQRAGAGTVTIGGRRHTIPDGDDGVRWLTQMVGPSAVTAPIPPRDWTVAGGEADRNAPGGDALPLGNAVWTQSLIRDRDFGIKDRFSEIEKTLEDYQNELIEAEALTVPSGTPLVIGNAAVFRAFARLRAVDLRTGEPLWDFAERERLYRILAAEQVPNRRNRLPNRLPVSMQSREQDEVRLFLNARTFRDMTYAGLSSDGERVFCILDGGFLGLDEILRAEQGDGLGARNQNVLAAVDLASGRLLWEVGGTRTDRNRDLAGTFFLGCGLPTDSALYVLGELDGEVSLFKLDPATGRRIWSQRLATPLGRLMHFPLRRLAGGNPSAAAGLLICPITGGVVTAIDPESRTLAWEYRYPSNRADPGSWPDEPLETASDETSRWLDSAPVIIDGAVLLTPRDSDELHCLNLSDGELRWKQPRGNRLFLAGSAEGVVYVVGRSGIEALKLSDGSAAWGQPIELGSPGGRGYRHGGLYHLPLATGELATIDLRRGRILTRTEFPENLKPGNLVAAEGAVVMESAGAIQGFRPTAELENSITQALERKSDDAAALAARGELRLHRGKTDAGLEDLTRSLGLKSDPRVQSVAVATVLENLRSDFPNNRELAQRFEPQIHESRQLVEFHRLMAAGLERGGDLEGALDHELQLLRDKPLAGTLLPIGESLKVQIAQVVAPELTALFSKANPDQRARLAKKVNDWTAGIVGDGKVEELRRAARALQSIPVDVDLRRILVDKLAPSDQAELVRQLTHLRQASDLKTAGTATARLARLLIDHHRADEALELLAQLGDRFKTVNCAGEKTGADLARSLGDDSAVKAARSRLAPWPGSEWIVKSTKQSHPVADSTVIPVDQLAGSFYRHWRFESRRASDRGFTLVAIDPSGNDRWQIELGSHNLGLGAWGDGPMVIRAQGPVLEVVLRRRIVVLDAFDGTHPPPILWSRGLFDPNWSAAKQMRSESGLTGLMTGECIYYQLGAALCAADLITGDVIWERRSIPFPYFLVGDRDYVIAIRRTEPMDPYGLVLRAASGAPVAAAGLLGMRGPLTDRWHGRSALTTLFTPEQLTCSMTDLVSRKVEWSHSYAMPSWPFPIDDDEFAVLDSGRRLHIHSTATGAQVFETELEPGTNSPQLSVRRQGNRYFVIRQTGAYMISPRYRERQQTAETAGLWAIDRDTGKVAWKTAIPTPQMLVELPAQSPVLVLLRPVTRLENPRSNGLGTYVSIVDVRTGKVIHEGREVTSPDRINVRFDSEAHMITVTTDKRRLEVTPKKAD
jgi:outer membrane protein assembly factor BamB